MKHLLRLILGCALCTMQAAEYKKPIIVCDLQLLATQEDPEASANVPITQAIKLFGSRPFLALKLGINQTNIKEAGKKMAQNGESGAANVTYKVLSPYGNITESDVKELTSYAINSTVKKTGLDLLTFLRKECKFDIIGLTDQDRVHHEIFRTKIKSAIDLDSELKGIVSLPFVLDKADVNSHPDHESWILANVKDVADCYQAAIAIANTIDNTAPIIVIKDKTSLVASQEGVFKDPALNERIIPVNFSNLATFKKFLKEKGYWLSNK